MPGIRRRRVYSGDAHHPQENLKGHLRIAQINTVNVEAGSCTIHWLDSGGGRVNVALSEGSWGEYNVPVPGAIVLVLCDIHDQAKIVRYANLNQFFDQKSIASGGTNLVQKLQAGDKFWHSSGNAYLYLNSVGRVVLADAEGDMLEIDADANLFKVTTVNWKVVSNAGAEYLGDVKRPGVTGPLDTVTDNMPTPTFPTGTPLEEYTLTVNDFNPDYKTGGVTTINVNLGTYVDAAGLVLNKQGIPTAASSPDALAVKIVVNTPNPTGKTTITIDKQGHVEVSAAQIVLTSPDIRLGTEFATQSGVLGTTLVSLLTKLINLFNTHSHASPGDPPAPSFIDSDDPTTVLATTVKLQ
jgi:hypothetical protein